MVFLFIFFCLSLSINRPVIGVMTQPTTSSLGHSSLPASYIKWLESGGAKVVPFLYDMNTTVAKTLFQCMFSFAFIFYSLFVFNKAINGFLYPALSAGLLSGS